MSIDLINPYQELDKLKGTRYKLTSSLSLSASLLQANLPPTSNYQNEYARHIQGRRLILDNPILESRYAKSFKVKKERRRLLEERKKTGVVGRSEAKRKGLWELDKSAAKYHLFLPIHRLWLAYVVELFNLPDGPEGELDQENLPSTSTMHGKLVKADFHGAIITVKESKNAATTRLSGIIVHETENTFKIVTKEDKLKVIPKRNTIFTFRVPVHGLPHSEISSYPLDSAATTPNAPPPTYSLLASPLDTVASLEFDLYGNQFCFRSADRATKKFKHKETVDDGPTLESVSHTMVRNSTLLENSTFVWPKVPDSVYDYHEPQNHGPTKFDSQLALEEQAWVESQLVGVIFQDGKTSAKIDSVITCEGDAEVGMRKSKLLTIYDLRLELKWSGVAAADENAVEGTITLPEVSHEVGADGDGDYQFETTLTTETPAARELYAITRKHLPAYLKKKLDPLPAEMLAAHGKDLRVEGTPSASGTATPVSGVGPAATAANVAAKMKTTEAKAIKGFNTSTVKIDATFAVSASDLFDLLTEEQKIVMWSRAAAKSTPKVDSEYSIFGGNIFGKYVEIQKPTKIVQTWTLKSPNWPENHGATLTTSLTQGSDSTTIVFELAGVPTGHEDEIRNNLSGY
ncbi:hypothetical protein FRB97_000839 [Tulasnella sp. 331]|nr:hypothetical protein FRB97_000839 [Tulasnella sp. 331]